MSWKRAVWWGWGPEGGNRPPQGWEAAQRGMWTNPYEQPTSAIGKGYQGFTQKDMETMLGFLSGKPGASLTQLGDPNLLTTQHGQSLRFLAKAKHYGYMTDPGVTRYRQQLRDLQEGGYEDKLRAVSQEAIGRSRGQERIGLGDQLAGQLGGGAVAPGVGQYINRKVDAALAGDLGEAYRQAAVSDINMRLQAGGALMQEQMVQQNLIKDIMRAEKDVIPLHQDVDKPNPWKQMGMQLLGSAASAGLGALTGGVGTAIGGALGQSIGGASPYQQQQPMPYGYGQMPMTYPTGLPRRPMAWG